MVDDREVTLHTAAGVEARRQALIRFLWGDAGFPFEALPTSVERDVASPVPDVEGLARVDLLRVEMEHHEHILAYHFIPATPNHRLVIVHQGHACTLDDRYPEKDLDGGIARTIAALVRGGYSVLGAFMPRFTPDQCVGGHNYMGAIETAGNPIKFFLEGIAASIRYLIAESEHDGFPWYVEFDMVGLSGGGWATTVYPAIDPRIRVSIPVAGSKPLYLRGRLAGDFEQSFDPFYEIAGYPDLYTLGSSGFGRRQIQVLNRHDTCCWGANQHNSLVTGLSWDAALRQYEGRVQDALVEIGSGSFRVVVDETADQHQISEATVDEVILRELALPYTCPAAPASCSEARRATLIVRSDAARPGRNRLWWQWRGDRGALTTASNDTEYRVCVYSGGVLVTDYAVQPGGNCGLHPCWRSADGESTYRNRDGNGDGISTLTIEDGRIHLRAEGARLALPRTTPMLSAESPVYVQLLRSGAGECWQSTFLPPARENTRERFRDSTP